MEKEIENVRKKFESELVGVCSGVEDVEALPSTGWDKDKIIKQVGGRAGHLRYFFIFSITKNHYLHFIKLI